MNQSKKDGPSSPARDQSTINADKGFAVPKPVPFTSDICSCDVPYERFRGLQAYAVTFVVGDSPVLDPGNEHVLLDSDVLYVTAHTRQEAIELGRKALSARCDGHCIYTVVGVYYIDQLLWFVQGAYRTLAGISVPTDPSNVDDPPHENFKPYGE